MKLNKLAIGIALGLTALGSVYSTSISAADFIIPPLLPPVITTVTTTAPVDNYRETYAYWVDSVITLPPHPTTTIKIVAFNDFHGQLESPGTFRQTPTSLAATNVAVGGVDWMAGYIAKLKSQNPNTVVVSAGDIIGATPLVSALFHDEGTIEAMNRLGLDFNSVGNHEFDEGKTELKRMQIGGCHPTDLNSCRGADVGTPVPFEGAKFKFLAANVVETATGNTIFPSYAINPSS
jgi:2',3'-cyclic-nucleotide 2'-phosphodiesterase (5'-nucleotidase family)